MSVRACETGARSHRHFEGWPRHRCVSGTGSDIGGGCGAAVLAIPLEGLPGILCRQCLFGAVGPRALGGWLQTRCGCAGENRYDTVECGACRNLPPQQVVDCDACDGAGEVFVDGSVSARSP